jgi:predicted aconitase
MRLTDEEKRILEGERGVAARRSMEFLVAYGEAADAEYLVDIDGTADIHPGTNPCWLEDYVIPHEDMVELVKKGEHFKVPTFANKPVSGFLIDGWERTGTWPESDPVYHMSRMEPIKVLIKLGMIPTYSCDYYLGTSFYPTTGQHCAWGESSAIPWCNAVLGARTNFDGNFHTAYLGKTPCWDLHLDENRLATVKLTYEGELKNDMDYELFGWAAGEKLGNKVPAFLNIGIPTVTQLVKMNGALNTGGQVRMYHIPGVTPEASTLDAAFGGAKPAEEIIVTRNDLREVYELLQFSGTRDVDYVYLGCPFYNIIELQKAARLLHGRKCRANLWIVTSPGVYTLAEQMGIREIIERAGGELYSGSCACELRGGVPPFLTMATDSTKQNYYMTGHMHPKEVGVFYGTVEDCIDAAVTGKWNAEWR